MFDLSARVDPLVTQPIKPQSVIFSSVLGPLVTKLSVKMRLEFSLQCHIFVIRVDTTTR